MKINPISNAGFFSGIQKNKVGKAQNGTSFYQAPDQVTFSKEGVSFAQALAQVREAREVEAPSRQARVDALAQQVRSGQYQVDALKVAQKIIDSVPNMGL